MKTCQSFVFAASAILAVMLSACPNPMDFTAASYTPAAIPGGGGNTVGIQDMGSFTVTIPVNPAPGRAAAGLNANAIQYGGVRNTYLLVVLDTAAGEVAVDPREGSRQNDNDTSTDVSVTIPPGKEYGFLLLVGHRERNYAQEVSGGDYLYKAGSPTLLYAGLTKEAITPSTTAVTITVKPLTVEAKFASATLGSDKNADTPKVELGAAADWTLTWTVTGLAPLKNAQASDGYLFREVNGKAWETGGSVSGEAAMGFSSNALFDGTGTVTLDLGRARGGVPCAAWFNLEYAPFSLAEGKWDRPLWVIRNGVNDLPQDSNTDFTYETNKMKWNTADGKNGNGAVCFTLPMPKITVYFGPIDTAVRKK
jgi:hypothetical protein